MEDKMNLDEIINCREIAFSELITEGKTYCSSGEIGEGNNIFNSKGYKPLIHLWEYYVNDLRSKWINNSEVKTRIELSIKEKRDLMILSNLDKDKVLISYMKGEQNHPEDKLILLKINIKCLIITFSRNINSNDEVTTNMKFYMDICNKKLKEEFQRTRIAQIINGIPIEEINHILNEENKIDSDNEEEEPIQNNPKTSLIFNNKQVFNLKRKHDISSYSKKTSNLMLERESNSDDRTLLSNRFSSSYKLGVNFSQKLKIDEISDCDSVDYMDKFDFEDKVGESKNENVRRSNILKNPFKKKIPKNSEILNNVPGSNSNKRFSYRKSIFSIVIGNINYQHTSLRNGKINLDTEINSVTFIDHNLSSLLLNNTIAVIMKSTENKFDEKIYNGKENDYLSLIFLAIFYDRNPYDILVNDTIHKALSFFIIETFQTFINKNKNIYTDIFALNSEFETPELKFISNYFFKFGLKKFN